MTESTAMAEALAARCHEVANLADAAAAWVGNDANRDKVGAEATSLRRRISPRRHPRAQARGRGDAEHVRGSVRAEPGGQVLSHLGPRTAEGRRAHGRLRRRGGADTVPRPDQPGGPGGIDGPRHPVHRRTGSGAPGLSGQGTVPVRIRRGEDPRQHLRHGRRQPGAGTEPGGDREAPDGRGGEGRGRPRTRPSPPRRCGTCRSTSPASSAGSPTSRRFVPSGTGRRRSCRGSIRPGAPNCCRSSGAATPL